MGLSRVEPAGRGGGRGPSRGDGGCGRTSGWFTYSERKEKESCEGGWNLCVPAATTALRQAPGRTPPPPTSQSLSSSWISYRAGGCRSRGQRSHQPREKGVLWGPHCTAVEGWSHVGGGSAAPWPPPFPSHHQTHQSLPLRKVPAEIWGAPPRRAPALVSAHHRHSEDKRRSKWR